MALTLLSIFFGAAFTLSTAYALGLVLLRKTPAPPEIVLGAGAVVQSLIVFLLLLANIAHWAVFLAVGSAALLSAWRWHGDLLREKIYIPVAVRIVLGVYGLWYF